MQLTDTGLFFTPVGPGAACDTYAAGVAEVVVKVRLAGAWNGGEGDARRTDRAEKFGHCGCRWAWVILSSLTGSSWGMLAGYVH